MDKTMTAAALTAAIRRLIATAESADDWGRICELEAQYVALTGKQVPLAA